MHRVMVLGAGKIGSLIAELLVRSGEYQVDLADRQMQGSMPAGVQLHLADLAEGEQVARLLKANPPQAVVSALPYYLNPQVARLAKDLGFHYLDLTEDTKVTQEIQALAQGSAQVFSPQCGLAPGFISIVAQSLITGFERLDQVKLRVGALPLNPSNSLKYSLTWSTDGLINEYGNPCWGIVNGQKLELLPLEGYETIEMDGLLYEAFNTSGGLGTLAETHQGRVNQMDYKTLRYPGHCEKIKFLMNDLKLNFHRDALKEILERSIPKTKQDVVLVYAYVSGWKGGDLMEETYFKKIYAQDIFGQSWSAIQITTASSLCVVLDLVLSQPGKYQGYLCQEAIPLGEFLANPFGRFYRD